ncbi:FHA domain-containing protein [Nocardia acidivorans]|uniref:FHA domain-containing protein n=1 Tax=Nocardia acidivorans TaxID=404580 RepID=UPI00083701D8|nr:FHA domain-containing protein [Nocardia acidivorans]
MGRIPTTVGLLRGDGLVARFGTVVIYLAGASPSTERILGAAETAATAADPGVAIAQRLAATVFSSGSAQPPSFGVVAPTAGGILVLLRGPIRAIVDGPEGTRQLSGVRAMTWVDEILDDPVRKLTVAAETDPGTVIAHTDLRSGVVAAGGFVVNAPPSGSSAHPRVTAAPKPAPPETHPATPTYDPTKRAPIPTPSHTRFSAPGGSQALPRDSAEGSTPSRRTAGDSEPLRRTAGSAEPVRPAPGDSEQNRRRAATTPAVPPPEETRALSALEAEESRVAADIPNLGKAVRHTGTPASSAAAETHLDAADQPPTAAHDSKTAAAEEDPFPKVKPVTGRPEPDTDKLGGSPGALTAPDGAVYPLDRPYVIGRDPMIDESVRRAAATAIVIPRDRHVSRVHAHVFIDKGTVLVRDAATPGGTYLAAPGAQDWIRVGQHPMELKPGWSLRVGDRILTYRPNPARH